MWTRKMSSEKELIDGKGGFQFCSLAGEKGWKMFQQKKWKTKQLLWIKKLCDNKAWCKRLTEFLLEIKLCIDFHNNEFNFCFVKFVLFLDYGSKIVA